MLYRLIGLLLMLGTSIAPVFSQHPVWESYPKTIDGHEQLMMVDMDLIDYAPMPDFKFLVSAKAKVASNLEGVSSSMLVPVMISLQDSMLIWFSEHADNVHAGRLGSEGQTVDWIYTNDTTDLREHLLSYYKDVAGNDFVVSLTFEVDTEWRHYREQIYPDKDSQEIMANYKVIFQLIGQGDKLITPRKVEHWLFFPDKASRKLFKKWAETEGYAIAAEDFVEDQPGIPFSILIHRNDAVNPEHINPITIDLRKRAEELGGFYDGWETIVVN